MDTILVMELYDLGSNLWPPHAADEDIFSGWVFYAFEDDVNDIMWRLLLARRFR